jgi:hypothetical protein
MPMRISNAPVPALTTDRAPDIRGSSNRTHSR